MPRWRPDGTKNPLQIIRLKRKMGNVSNASSETELRGALGWMVGPEGRGVATIIEMVAMTRFDCMIGSSAGMRMAVSQAIDHCRQRKAFGAFLIDQPIMTAVLADLAIEAEAALTLTMRIARALDHRDDAHEDALARIGSAIGKYWICKRTPGHAYEALECLGGSGVMEDSPMPRLYREAPVNAIWEGSGNVQCLDIARAIQRSPQTLEAYFAEVASVKGESATLDRHAAALKDDTRDLSDFETRARDLCDRLALVLQAAALIRAGSPVAEAFCRSRLETRGAHNYGALTGSMRRRSSSAPRRAEPQPGQALLQVEQATAPTRRRRAAKASAPKPVSIIAQVEASGAEVAKPPWVTFGLSSRLNPCLAKEGSTVIIGSADAIKGPPPNAAVPPTKSISSTSCVFEVAEKSVSN